MNTFVEKIRKAPLALTIPLASFVVLLGIAGAAAMIPHRHGIVTKLPPHTSKAVQQPKPMPAAPAQKASIASTIAPAMPTQKASAASSITPAASTSVTPAGIPAAIDPSAMRVLLPGTVQPLNLTEQRATYTLEAAQRINYGEFGTMARIGAATVEARASSFSSLPMSTLAASMPSGGKAAESWAFYTNVSMPGTHLFALKLSGAEAKAAALIDGQTKPVVAVEGLGNIDVTGIGQVQLGAGWHTITVRIVHLASPRETAGDVSASLFVRGPGDSAPRSITPYSIDASAAASAPASSTSTARAAPRTGEAK